MKDFKKEKISAADLLVERNLAKNKHDAEALIIAGKVFHKNEPVKKSGQILLKCSEIEIKNIRDFVSRGALKLKKAIAEFGISLDGKKVIDIGSSTGGFTDYMIHNGAVSVIAVDVNYGQFDWKLRNNPDVYLLERTNIKNLSKKDLPSIPDLATADLSFISIRNVFRHIYDLVSDNGEILLLVKPQFEAGKEFVGEKGIITDKTTHFNIMEELIIFLINNYFVELKGITFSPVKGSKGNIEFWIYLKKHVNNNYKINKISYDKIFETIKKIINEAHNNLN